MEQQSFANVWDAIENTPAEAAIMTMRSHLMMAVIRQVKGWDVTRDKAAGRLGITRTRLNDLMRGRITKFDTDTLITLATQAGFALQLDIVEARDHPAFANSRCAKPRRIFSSCSNCSAATGMFVPGGKIAAAPKS
jgi:predicted XRE-type DNA-binding protein